MFSIKAIVILVSAYYVFCKTCPFEHTSNVGIMGGHPISIKQAPYIASLRVNGGVAHICGSSIIHERFVLTAAHCVVINRKYKILVGTDKVDKGGMLYDVENILIHQKYSNKANDYDVAVLKLNDTLTFGPTVNIIKLNDMRIPKGISLNATGWGHTKPNGTVSEDLRQVTLSYVPRLLCKLIYVCLRHPVTPRMICAGGFGKDTCQGDSGGPLTWNDALVGVTSFGVSTGMLPGVYTKVTAVKTWINQTIQKNL